MGLIHWWPLNGDLNDKVGAVPLTGNFNLQTNGKIGSCAQQNSARLTAENTALKNLYSFSIAMWVKFSSTASTAWSDLFGFAASNGAVSDSMRTEVTSNGGNSFSTFCNTISGTSSGFANFNLTKDIWTHLVFIKDKEKLVVYKDGVAQNNSTVEAFGAAYATGEFHIGDTNFYGAYNDVRVYDHVLSQAEIKELSKALVMHYTFDDVLAEETINIGDINSWYTFGSYWTIKERIAHGLKLYRHQGSTNSCVAIANSTVTSEMAQGDIWTFSCYLYKNNQPWKSTASGISSESYGYKTVSWESRSDGYYRITFQVIASPGTWVLHNYFFDPIDIDVDCEMRHMQFEKKDHATPYTPTTRNSMIRNEAETIQSSTVSNIVLVADSASGSYSLKCAGSTYLKHTPAGDGSNATASFWLKNFDPNGQMVAFADANSKLAFGSYTNYSCISCQSGLFSQVATSEINKYWKSTEWNHIVVRKNSSNEYSCFINGNKVNNTAGDYWTHDTYLSIGCRISGGVVGRQAVGLIDDFRLYHTYLSEADIQELYKIKAYITNKDDILCGEFIEGKDSVQITNRYTLEAKEIYEEFDPAYERLEYLTTNGSQYIYTNIYSSENISCIQSKFKQGSADNFTKGQMLMGCYDGVSTLYFIYKEAGNLANVRSHWRYQDLTTTAPWGGDQLIEAELVEKDKTVSFTANGSTITKEFAKTKNGSYNMPLFGYTEKGSNVSYLFYGDLYDFKLWVDNKLVRDYIPVRRKGDKVVGLYDRVNKTFSSSEGQQDFIAGPVLTDGTAFIHKTGRVGTRQIIEI